MGSLSRLRAEAEKIFDASIDYKKNIDDKEIRFLIEKAVGAICEKEYITLDTRKQLVKEIFDKRRKYGIIEPLLEDPDVSEIMINGTDDIFFEKDGMITRYAGCFDSKETLIKTIRNMMLVSDRTINEKNPIADARLAGGERICAVLDNVAINGPVLSIRKFNNSFASLDKLISSNTLDDEIARFLGEIVGKKYNIIVSGGTSSGKTTLLNILSEFIGKYERVVTIEDSLELNLMHVENIIKLETKEDILDIDARKLVKTALRLRPDRIIVGEVRGREAFYMLQAMNTGHDGSMSTIHANSCKDTLTRLEGMVGSEFDIPVLSIKTYICSAIDILIHMKREADGGRYIKEIAQLMEIKDGQYHANNIFEHKGGAFRKTGELLPKGS